MDFGAKLDISIDSDGYARNVRDIIRSVCWQIRYIGQERIGVSVKKGIWLLGSRLDRSNPTTVKTDKKEEYQDNTDRIAVECEFSREKDATEWGGS